MSYAIVVQGCGGPDVMSFISHPAQDPGPGEVRIRQRAIAVNHADIHYRRGDLPVPAFPAILGTEAAGEVDAIGEGVEGLEIGQSVGYATGGLGAYVQYRTISAHHVISLPDHMSHDMAAAVLSKGMAAHYLCRRTFRLHGRCIVLIHGAAGALGHLLCQWAQHDGGYVIGTVGQSSKVDVAKANGCNVVIDRSRESTFDRIREITGDRGVTVTYDLIGRETFASSVRCTGPFGLVVQVGQTSGPPEPVLLQKLQQKSLFVTAPVLEHYKHHRMELLLSAGELFEMIKQQLLTVTYQSMSWEKAAQAHHLIETRRSTHPLILTL